MPGGAAAVSCLRSASAVAYSDAQACASFAAAYSTASSGDTVGVTGTLGPQLFAGGYNASQAAGTKTIRSVTRPAT